MDMGVTATVTTPTAGPATPTMDMVATTSVMLMLRPAMAMVATPGPAMVATPLCTDRPRDLVHPMDTMVMVITKLNQTRASSTTKSSNARKSYPVLPCGHKKNTFF